jgi:SAM-dependent methyltransferase
VFTAVYERLARAAEPWEGPHRTELCADVGGLVLEIGAGTGASFRRYERARRVVAIEPEPNMRRRAAPRAEQALVPIVLLSAVAERLPFADETFDAVVCSLSLCSVADLGAAVAECRRVLRPGGSFRFYEHVRSERPRTARFQDALERPWGFFVGGCHPNRDVLGTLEAYGFRLRYRRFDPPAPGGRFMPHVLGEGELEPTTETLRTAGPT